MKALNSYATRRFFSGTFLSRISGLLRDLVMAFIFGDHPSVAAFMVAFRFSNLFRRLLGEGPFQSIFIPYYEEMRIRGHREASLFFRNLSSWILLLLLGIALVSEIALGIIGYCGSLSRNNQEILILTAWMIPGLLFICLYGLNLSLLHCHDSFFLPSFAPFFCNAIWIGGAIALRNREPSFAMLGLAKLIVLGFALQWAFTFYFTWKHVAASLREWISFKIPQEIKELAKSFTYGMIGAGAVQVNILLDALFARSANLRAPVYLWYSIRLEQLVLAIFGFACVSTMVPQLVRAIKSENNPLAQTYFSLSFTRIFAVLIPATFALLLLGGVSVNILYGRGQFFGEAITQTTFCLWAYAFSLIPSTLVMLLSTLFTAGGDFKTPMVISLFSVFLNISFNALFVFGMGLGAVSIALATSLSVWVNFFILYRIAHRHGWRLNCSVLRIFQVIYASLFALSCAFLIEYLIFENSMLAFFISNEVLFSREFSNQMMQFGLLFLSFVAGLWLYAKCKKNQDLFELFRLFWPQRKQLPKTF